MRGMGDSTVVRRRTPVDLRAAIEHAGDDRRRRLRRHLRPNLRIGRVPGKAMRAWSGRRCGGGERSPSADVAGVSLSPIGSRCGDCCETARFVCFGLFAF